MARLDWESIQGLSLPERNVIALTHVGAILILANSVFYRQRYNWTFGENELTDSQWDDIGHCIGRMEHELMSGLIGAIIPHVMGSLSGLTMLPCEGSTYLRVDYPLLYAAIDAEFIIDADSFRVPDLRDKFPLAAGDNYPIGTEGGEETVLLTISTLPSHTHGNVPHEHGYIEPISTVINGGLEAPASAATPFPNYTDSAIIEIDETGGDEPHNNMPPFVAIRWAIVAG